MSTPQAPHVIAGVDVTPVFGQASGMQLREEVKIHDTPRTNSNAHSFFVFNFLQNVIFSVDSILLSVRKHCHGIP